MEEELKRILAIALKHHVTDIHLNLMEDDQLGIEMRVDGVIRKVRSAEEDGRFFRYLMYRANLDLSNSMIPQTGRFETEVDGKKLALRFALVSSYHVTCGVIRILNSHGAITTDMLSSDPEQNAYFRSICTHRSGLFVFSGPTGSGKTTTLYTILNEVTGKKIFSLEDPVEIYSEKYVQLSVNDKAHLSYADGIRQLMRHDPDIVMIGEIRDEPAAQMAVRCALTGHLVVTSLHAGSCISAIDRLLDLGVAKLQLQDVLRGISCQRLYASDHGKKIGVYELMDRKEVDYYFTHQHTSPSFRTLQEQILLAAERGAVSLAEASQDLD